MNITMPKVSGIKSKQYEFRQRNWKHNNHTSPSFKGDAVTSLFQTVQNLDKYNPKLFKTARDIDVYNILIKHFGDIPKIMDRKLNKLASSNGILSKKARFDLNVGVSSIKEKSIITSLIENIIAPVVTFPSYLGSKILEKIEKANLAKISANADKISEGAGRIRDLSIFRVPRKLNEMDFLTNSIDGMVKGTNDFIEKFAQKTDIKANGKLMTEIPEKVDRIYEILRTPVEKLSVEDAEIQQKANEFLQRNLYKKSNKFFDKHIGSFNTAHERPLNRIVTGFVPIAFLANDAYNLSVLCGDKKEDSQKEANSRARQEFTRVLTTAYIQLLTFGALTKYVNTKAWFTPLTSALTVLGSEIFSRKRIGKPIMFLSKEGAKEYNRTQEKAKTGSDKKTVKANEKQVTDTNIEQYKKLNFDFNKDKSQVFTSFKGAETEKKNDKKDSQPKALINFKTFKKGIGILLVGGFALSFIKNSSYTKNSTIVKGLQGIFKKVKDNVYKPLAFKDFEITDKEFNDIMNSLKESGNECIAKGHEAVRTLYQKSGNNGTFKILRATISKTQTDNITQGTIEAAKKVTGDLTEKQLSIVKDAVNKALQVEQESISEMQFEDVAKRIHSIITKKGINISQEKTKEFIDSIVRTINKVDKDNNPLNYSLEPIKMDTKLKPYIDMVIQPFKFIGSVLAFPFKKIATPIIGMLTSGVKKRVAAFELGEGELKKFDEQIYKVVRNIFGEQKSKTGKISQEIFTNAVDQLGKKTAKYRELSASYEKLSAEAKKQIDNIDLQKQLEDVEYKLIAEKKNLSTYIAKSLERSFDGITTSNSKNTDLAMMSKLASSAVTSAFLVADNYNMVMLKSDGEDKEGAKEKANERIIQRLSALFYQSMLINWFNSTFQATYNSSLGGMMMVSGPNTLATEVLTRKSIGMPIGRKTLEELNAIDEKNEKRTGFLGKYFKFMRLLTGKKPLKDRLPKNKQVQETKEEKPQNTNLLEIKNSKTSTNVLEELLKK